VLFANRFRTEDAVAAFFTPASQKPKDPTVWSERAATRDPKARATLLVARYKHETGGPPSKRRKIAAFDLVSPSFP